MTIEALDFHHSNLIQWAQCFIHLALRNCSEKVKIISERAMSIFTRANLIQTISVEDVCFDHFIQSQVEISPQLFLNGRTHHFCVKVGACRSGNNII